MRPLALLLVCLSCAAARADAAVERFTLPNGVRVVLAPSFHGSRVMLHVRYAVGSRDDPPGYRGLAHLTEHLTFTQLDALAELEKLGGSHIDGITSPDDTTYFAFLPRRSLESALWLGASRMAFHVDRLNQRELANVEQVVVAEWREHRHDSGMSAGELELVRALYPEDHPYRMRGDDPDDVRAVKLSDVQWFAQRYYRPERATVVVIGAFDADAARGWVKRYFGVVRGTGEAGVRSQKLAPAPLAKSCVLDVPANLVDEGLQATWLGPPAGSDDDLVLEVIDALLQGYPGAPLLELVQNVPEIASASIGHVRLELAHEIRIGIGARAPAEAQSLVPELDAVLAALREGALNASLPRAVARAIDAAERAQDQLSERAAVLADEHVPPLAEHIARLQKVQARDVVRVAGKWLDPKRRVLTYFTGRDAETGRTHVDCEPAP